MDLIDAQEEDKSFEVPKQITRADTNFSLKMYHELGEDESNISITVGELEKLNENQEISPSILDFIMKSKSEEFKNKNVIVLTTPVIGRLKADYEGEQGQILKEAIGGSAFDYEAVALPNVTEDCWELFVIENTSQLFKDTFSKLKEGISNVVSSIGSFFTGSSSDKKNPRLLHLVGGESGHTSKEIIYSTLNQHFKTLYPDSSIAEYLNFGTGEINEEQLPYQRVEVEKGAGSTSLRGGEFIYAFMRRCYIDGRPFPANKNDINQETFFAHNNFSFSELIHILKDLPGTEVNEGWDGSVKILKSPRVGLKNRAPSTTLEIFIEGELVYERHRENKKEQEEEQQRLRNASLEIWVEDKLEYERHTNQTQGRKQGSSLEIWVENELVCKKHRHEYFIRREGEVEDRDTSDSDKDHDSVQEMKLVLEGYGDSDESEVDELQGKFRTQPLPNAKTKKKGKGRVEESKEEYPEYQNSYFAQDLVGEPSKNTLHDYNTYRDAAPEFTVSRGIHTAQEEISPPSKEGRKRKLEIQDASHRESGCCSSCSIF